MAGMALWSDGKIENEESYFIKLAEMIKTRCICNGEY
jgi:hypothetical protein